MTAHSVFLRRTGFTLVELMVATTLMLMLILCVAYIASDTVRAYDRAVGDLATQSEARGVLDALENDLQTAVIRPDNRIWMEVVLPGWSDGVSTPAPPRAGNLKAGDHPILMFFASPVDRPRWVPASTTLASARVALKGDTCAVAYRIGLRSPFDSTSTTNYFQQVYGVYRTIIDSQNTYSDALNGLYAGSLSTSPWNYWSVGSHTVQQYAPPPSGSIGPVSKTLIDSTSTCWTLDDQNFIGANVVAMNLIFWCASTSPAASDLLSRPPSVLRPVIVYDSMAEDKSFKYGNGVGYDDILKTPLRRMPSDPGASDVKGYDYFKTRLRIRSDRIYQDAYDPMKTVPAPDPYLPYSLRAVEVSITVLTPEGSKELRTLQDKSKSGALSDEAAFKRIVSKYGRNYTRYIRIMGNGG